MDQETIKQWRQYKQWQDDKNDKEEKEYDDKIKIMVEKKKEENRIKREKGLDMIFWDIPQWIPFERTETSWNGFMDWLSTLDT